MLKSNESARVGRLYALAEANEEEALAAIFTGAGLSLCKYISHFLPALLLAAAVDVDLLPDADA